jgi:hypothetical protein
MASKLPLQRMTIPSCMQKCGIYVFLISIASAYYLLNAPILLGHYDLGWHLAAGDLIRARGSIPSHDPWSFTAGAKPWINLSWLWDVIASFLFQETGFGGLVLLTVACGAAIAGNLAAIGLRSGASAVAVCIAVLSASLLYPAFATFPNVYLAAAPNMATMLFSVIFYGECLGPSRRIYLLPALMLLWANLHGGFLIGLFIVGFFGGVALLRQDWRNFKIYGAVAVACFIAALANPLGWHIYQGTTTTLGNLVQTQITEWLPYYRNVTLPGSLPGILYILIFASLELRDARSGPIEARLLSWLFLFLGLYQFRYMSFFFLFSAIPLALHLDRHLTRRPGDPAAAKYLLVAGIVTACVLPVIFLRMVPGFALPDMISKRDVQYLETRYPHARLLNHWNYGGLLIYYTRGAVPVFVDGRASTVYPDGLLRDYFKLTEWKVDEAAWDAVLGKYRIDAVLWVRAHQELRRFLVEKRGWKEAHTGSYASLYVRP